MLSRYAFRTTTSAVSTTTAATCATAAALVSSCCSSSSVVTAPIRANFSSSSAFVATCAPASLCSRRWCAKKAEPATEEKKDWPDTEAMEAEIKKLQEALKKKTEEVDEFKKQATYQAADASNARRIAAEDVAKAKNFGITSFAKDMLDVNDTLERAIEAFGKLNPDEVKFLTEHKLFSQLVTGVKLSHNQMLHNMGRHGIELIEVNPGDEFDANKHEAVFNAPATAEIKPGQVAVALKKGYMLKERVLRAPQVGVAQKQ